MSIWAIWLWAFVFGVPLVWALLAFVAIQAGIRRQENFRYHLIILALVSIVVIPGYTIYIQTIWPILFPL